MVDKFYAPLQESILALLATNDKQGRVAAHLLDAGIFNDTYQEFARRVIDYQRKHAKAPGRAHLDDLVDDILTNPSHKQHKSTVRIIEGVLDQAEGLNPEYLLARVGDFTRRQRLKVAITEASETYVQGEDTTEQVEGILLKALRQPAVGVDAGVRLNERRKMLQFLSSMDIDYSLGVPEFDRANFGLSIGKALLLIAPKGAGKSWACVDVGKRCLMQNAKVVHYTLENSWQQTVGRYYTSMFAAPTRRGEKDERIEIARLQLDSLGRLEKRTVEKHRPKLAMDDPGVRRKLGRKIDEWGAMLGNLVVKEFPSGALTLDALEGHLEYLELAEKFVPHVIILDYFDLMSFKGDDLRIALGRTFVGLRGLLQRRRLAGFFPTQGNRSSWDAKTMTASMVAEDASKVLTADRVMLYSQTKQEHQLSLARLSVPHNRDGKDKFSVVVSQSYDTGQFVVDSARFGNNYFDMVGADAMEE